LEKSFYLFHHYSFHQLLFKVKWQTQNKTAPIVPADIEIIYNLAQQLKLIQFLNTIGAILTLIALPLSIIGKASHTLIALIIIVIYAINLINILMIFCSAKHYLFVLKPYCYCF
jgi:hypothetical protein